MADLPQPAWPLQFVTNPDGTVSFAEVEQATGPDRQARAAIVLCTPKGWRDDDPSFGVSDLRFQQGAIDTHRLAAELNASDPAIQATADEVIDLLAPTLRVVRVNVTDQAT